MEESGRAVHARVATRFCCIVAGVQSPKSNRPLPPCRPGSLRSWRAGSTQNATANGTARSKLIRNPARSIPCCARWRKTSPKDGCVWRMARARRPGRCRARLSQPSSNFGLASSAGVNSNTQLPCKAPSGTHLPRKSCFLSALLLLLGYSPGDPESTNQIRPKIDISCVTAKNIIWPVEIITEFVAQIIK